MKHLQPQLHKPPPSSDSHTLAFTQDQAHPGVRNQHLRPAVDGWRLLMKAHRGSAVAERDTSATCSPWGRQRCLEKTTVNGICLVGLRLPQKAVMVFAVAPAAPAVSPHRRTLLGKPIYYCEWSHHPSRASAAGPELLSLPPRGAAKLQNLRMLTVVLGSHLGAPCLPVLAKNPDRA